MKTEALVIKSTGNIYKIKILGTSEIIEARLRGKFRLSEIKNTNPITVGDKVKFYLDEDGKAVIENILPRKNYIIRKSVNLSKKNHIIASNVDQCILVNTVIDPEISLSFIDRFLVVAEAYNVPVILVFNKIDLLEKTFYLEEIKNIYKKIGYKTLDISCKTKQGIESLKNILKDKISLISGNSGVGKTTIINCLNPNLSLKTQNISEYHKKGQHTTTFSELFEWDFGGYIIDTPGVKSFGIVDDLSRNDIKNYFVEFFKLSKGCKYNNCMHLNEPQCNILSNLDSGKVSKSRYKTYLSILEELK